MNGRREVLDGGPDRFEKRDLVAGEPPPNLTAAEVEQVAGYVLAPKNACLRGLEES